MQKETTIANLFGKSIYKTIINNYDTINKKLVTELIQNDFNYKSLSDEIDKFDNNYHVDKMISGYERLKKIIGNKNATNEVAKNILENL